MEEQPAPVAAVVAAAGFSRRMGRFKQLLPWGDGTVIETVVDHLHRAGAHPILCIVGHRGDEVAAVLASGPARVRTNPRFSVDEMLSSYQTGVAALADWGVAEPIGALLALGDQPHIPVEILGRLVGRAREAPDRIVIPSHARRRGHPIYLPRHLWPALLSLDPDRSLRDLLGRNEDEIVYLPVESDAIRRDMDTWSQYEALRRTHDGP